MHVIKLRKEIADQTSKLSKGFFLGGGVREFCMRNINKHYLFNWAGAVYC